MRNHRFAALFIEVTGEAQSPLVMSATIAFTIWMGVAISNHGRCRQDGIALMPSFYGPAVSMRGWEAAVILFIGSMPVRFAQPELRQHRVVVNTHHISDLIEKGIRRFLNRFSDIQHTRVRFSVPVMTLRAGKRRGWRAKEGGLRRNNPHNSADIAIRV